ncbi:MAG: hypothetical protein VYE77_03320, partial [Planctomycetota bacterium]|nr:hypothetical protein [Planctomycetota bacterium]
MRQPGDPDDELEEMEELQDGPAIVLEATGDDASVVVQQSLPDRMFVFPLRRAVPFPNLMMPLLLDDQQARD